MAQKNDEQKKRTAPSTAKSAWVAPKLARETIISARFSSGTFSDGITIS